MVLVRSNSRISGRTSDERKIGPIGQGRAQPGADGSLVGVVEERVQETDGDRLDVVALDEVDGVVDVLVAQRFHEGALGVDALGDLQAMVARHQHRGGVLEEVVEGGARGAAQLQHVAEAPRGDEGRARALALQEGVGHHGGGVGEEGSRRRARGRGAAEPLPRASSTPRPKSRGVVETFTTRDPRAALLGEHDIGEGAADVDAEAPAHRRAPAPLRLRGSAARASANTWRVRGDVLVAVGERHVDLLHRP